MEADMSDRRRGRKKQSEKVDWEQIKNEYVFGVQLENGTTHYPTLKELSEKYNIPVSTVHYYSTKQQWLQQKEESIRRVQRKIQKEQEKKLVKEGYEFNESCLQISKTALDILSRKLRNNKGEVNYKIDTIEVRRVLDATQIAQNIAVKAMETRTDTKSAIDDLVSIFQEYWDENI